MVATADKKKQPASKGETKGASSSSLKVLVVEDFKTMRKAVVKVLAGLGMKVIEVNVKFYILVCACKVFF